MAHHLLLEEMLFIYIDFLYFVIIALELGYHSRCVLVLKHPKQFLELVI